MDSAVIPAIYFILMVLFGLALILLILYLLAKNGKLTCCAPWALVRIEVQRSETNRWDAKMSEFSSWFHKNGLLIKRDQLFIYSRTFAQGCFSVVFNGVYRTADKRTPVVIKKAKNHWPERLHQAAIEELLNEAVEQGKLQVREACENIVKLHGVCFMIDDDVMYSTPIVILEKLYGGSLEQLLLDVRSSSAPNPTVCQLLRILVQVCKACAYLARNNRFHRDVRSSNVLLSTRDLNKTLVKLGDFGLAREPAMNTYYYLKDSSVVPIAWTPPEVFNVHKYFVEKSDVWEFGVLTWECFTIGCVPHSGRTIQQVKRMVTSTDPARRCLPKPPDCPEEIYNLIKTCWSDRLQLRPTFVEIEQKLHKILKSENTSVDQIVKPPEQNWGLHDSDVEAYINEGALCTHPMRPVESELNTGASIEVEMYPRLQTVAVRQKERQTI